MLSLCRAWLWLHFVKAIFTCIQKYGAMIKKLSRPVSSIWSGKETHSASKRCVLLSGQGGNRHLKKFTSFKLRESRSLRVSVDIIRGGTRKPDPLRIGEAEN